MKSASSSEDAARRATDAEAAHTANTEVRQFWQQYRQATALRMNGQWEAAAEAYQKALALQETHEDAWYYLGNVLLERGRYAEARAAWERLAEVNPNSSRAYAQLGDLHLCIDRDDLFDLDAAEHAFLQALAINKEETGPVLRLGEVALLRGDRAEARRLFDAVTGSNFQSIEAHFLKGYLAWKEGNQQQAATHFIEAVQHAQPQEAPQGVLGEGDTRSGQTPMVVAAAMCPLFHPFLNNPALLDTSQRAVNQQYRAVDARLARLR